MQDRGMRINDLGELVGDVLLFGGPYSNLQASQALLSIAQKLNIPPENRICTGDMVAYCGDPLKTLHLWRDECVLVAGNCEKQLAAGAADCGCGFAAGSACDLLSKDWYPFASGALSDGDRDYLAGAAHAVTFQRDGARYAVIHGGLSDVARYLWPQSPEAEFAEEIKVVREVLGDVDCIIAGHCGMAFRRQVNGVTWLNAGVIGMPANDGTPDTSYAILSDTGFQIERLAYDFRGAQSTMRQAGLGQGYEQALGSGLWPSQDILPVAMRR